MELIFISGGWELLLLDRNRKEKKEKRKEFKGNHPARLA
jgi:hypothetical protein